MRRIFVSGVLVASLAAPLGWGPGRTAVVSASAYGWRTDGALVSVEAIGNGATTRVHMSIDDAAGNPLCRSDSVPVGKAVFLSDGRTFAVLNVLRGPTTCGPALIRWTPDPSLAGTGVTWGLYTNPEEVVCFPTNRGVFVRIDRLASFSSPVKVAGRVGDLPFYGSGYISPGFSGVGVSHEQRVPLWIHCVR